MEIRPITDDDLSTLAGVAAGLQMHQASHIAYLGLEVDGIEAELVDTTWRDCGAVAIENGEVVGWLVGDVEPPMGRVWWFGPFVAAGDWESIATALLAACRAQLADNVDEEEMAIDSQFEGYREWAIALGFHDEEGSLALTLERPVEAPAVLVREIADDDHDAVVELHDQLFPGTHTTGRDLVAGHDDTHRRLVVDVEGAIAGYIAVERQADGSGYIDYLGVAPSMRRRGLGAELVRAGVAELRRLDSSPIALTVRLGSDGARELYASLGFTEERVLIPLRKGFSLA